MKRALAATAVLGLLASCGGTSATSATPPTREPAAPGPVRYLALGDSVTAQRAEFNSILVSEGKAVGATYVDLNALFEDQADKQMWLEDELHPTAEAYQGWAAELFEKVENPCES